jgi:hypothetical protein
MQEMSNRDLNAHRYAKLSLASIMITAIFTAIHHVYRLGLGALIPFAIILVLPLLLMVRFRQTGNSTVLWSYGLFNGLIFLWFGFIDGFLDHVIKALGLPHFGLLPGSDELVVKTVFSPWSPEAGNLFYEGTGVLQFITSVFALYYCYRFIQANRTSKLVRNTGLPTPTR